MGIVTYRDDLIDGTRERVLQTARAGLAQARRLARATTSAELAHQADRFASIVAQLGAGGADEGTGATSPTGPAAGANASDRLRRLGEERGRLQRELTASRLREVASRARAERESFIAEQLRRELAAARRKLASHEPDAR